MNDKIKEDLFKFFNAPGFCNIEELENSKKFLTNLNKNLKIYFDCVGYLPQGLMLESNLATVDWYIERRKYIVHTETILNE